MFIPQSNQTSMLGQRSRCSRLSPTASTRFTVIGVFDRRFFLISRSYYTPHLLSTKIRSLFSFICNVSYTSHPRFFLSFHMHICKPLYHIITMSFSYHVLFYTCIIFHNNMNFRIKLLLSTHSQRVFNGARRFCYLMESVWCRTGPRTPDERVSHRHDYFIRCH